VKTLSSLYQNPKHTYLTQQQAIWWVCFLLQSGDTYQAKIQADLMQYPNLKLSACILNKALKFMVAKKLIISYQQPIKGRGQARKMYQVNSACRAIINDFANMWRENNGHFTAKL
jgi:DNA-binding PadR family transcriptional regulator